MVVLFSVAPANVLHRSFPSFHFGGARPRRSKLSVSSSRSSDVGDSYLVMWKKAVELDRKSLDFLKIAEVVPEQANAPLESKETVERKTELFNKIIGVPKVERDRVQSLQVIDRASAAIAAARVFLRESPPPKPPSEKPHGSPSEGGLSRGEVLKEIIVSAPEFQGTFAHGTPGPDFWSWSPPMDYETSDNATSLQPAKQLVKQPNASYLVVEKEKSDFILQLPFESTFENQHIPLLPPLQSAMEVKRTEIESFTDIMTEINQDKLEVVFSKNATEASEALCKSNQGSSYGVNPDGSKWWSESCVDQRPDGVVCKWTLNRGVSADEKIEWEDKFWEASDQFNYKELGSEKSGRDADGNVWRESWRESMQQGNKNVKCHKCGKMGHYKSECTTEDLSSGLLHFGKLADKWGKNGKGDEWQEKWWEHYDASGQTEKWAHKWCCIDPNTNLETGHAHIWHERWGEKFDGKGGSVKYTDKWAERSEDGGLWSKWGDKWDEHFDPYGHGVKQGEKWWEGQHGERWNRTWGEQHNGTGWVHKYGKSSSGEHWDTHMQQDTWYERYPHYGFQHCFDNSPQLRAVKKPFQPTREL